MVMMMMMMTTTNYLDSFFVNYVIGNKDGSRPICRRLGYNGRVHVIRYGIDRLVD